MINRLRKIAQLVSLRELRNAVMGTVVVFGGLGLAILTLYAHRTGNLELAGITAAASLVFVFLIIIFVIPPLARSASAEASQMNLPFEFTTGGAISIGLSIIVAFAAWNTGNNLIFLVLSFFVSVLFVGFISGNICLRKLDVKLRFPESIYAGELTPIIVGISNRKRLFPTISVTTEVRGKMRELSKFVGEFKKVMPEKLAKRISRPPVIKHTLNYFVYVPSKESTEERVEHVFAQRGRFIILDFELSTRFPFGFFRHRRRLPTKKAEIIVYPRILPIDGDRAWLPLDNGKLTSSVRGSGRDLFAMREYMPTDDFRHIDWKATARSSNLTVREFTAEDEKRITVLFDPRMRESQAERETSLRQKIKDEQSGVKLSESEKRFEEGVSKAASILSHFGGDMAETRLILGNEAQSYGAGIEHLNRSFEKLALVEPVFESDSESLEFLDEYEHLFAAARSSDHIYIVTSRNENEFSSEISKAFTRIGF